MSLGSIPFYLNVLKDLTENKTEVNITIFTSHLKTADTRLLLKELFDKKLVTVRILIPQKGDRIFHMKIINVDDKTFYMGSANDSFYAYQKNWGKYYLIDRDTLLIKFYMLMIMQCIERYITP